MNKIIRGLAVILAYLVVTASAFGQNNGATTNHAFPIGKGIAQQGFTSLLCGAGTIPIGQAGADPICRSITGDITISAAGVAAIGATVVHSAMLNADVFSTAHSWAGQQTLVAPILGTPASVTLTNATGMPFTGMTGSASSAQIAGSAASHAVPVDVAGTMTFKVVPDCQDTTGNHINYTQSTDIFSCGNTSSGGGGSATIVGPQGRLTLVTGVPVMVSNQTAKGTIFYDCFRGNLVPYWNGSTDNLDTVSSCEVSDVMVSAASAGQVVSGQLYDVWWVHGGASRICLAMSAAVGGGGGWASDTGGSSTARGTGYSQLDLTTRPYPTNKNSITNCFNAATNYGPVSANQATYLGTALATANGQTGMAFQASASGAGTGGGGNVLGLYNAHNRVTIPGLSQDTTVGWNITSVTWRKANASANNSISFVDGMGQSTVRSTYSVAVEPLGAPAGGVFGIALDWTSGAPQVMGVVWSGATGPGAQVNSQGSVRATFLPVTGLHVLNAVEAGFNATGATFYGNFGTVPTQVQALTIELDM